jgi:hypothetical protein
MIRAPATRGRFADHGQVGGAELAGLIQHERVIPVQRHGPAQLVGPFDLAEKLGDVVALGQALVRQHPGRVGRRGQADDPPTCERGPQPGELGHGVALARPGRGSKHGRGRGGGEHHHHSVALPGGQAGAPSGHQGLLRADELRHGLSGGGEDVLFGVQVRQRCVPFFVRRPVDAAAVRGADAQAGHVGDVRGGDLDDPCPGPARDGQRGDLGDHRLAVRARRQHGKRPVHLEPELGHRPGGVVALHLGDGDPRGGALGRIIQHRRCTPGLAGGEPGGLLVHRGQRLHFPVHGVRFPGGQPLCRCGLRRSGLPGDGAAGLGLAAAGVLPGLLVQQPQRAPARRPAVLVLVLLRELVQLPGDGDGAGAEQVHHVLADAADLGAVAVRAGHHGVAERRQPGLHTAVRDRREAEPLAVQGAGVQGPPLVVGAVGALHPVPDRHVHVQLRVAVAGQVVQEQAGHQAGTVPPLPGAGRVVPGAGVGGVPVQPAHRVPRRVHQRVLDLVRLRVERGGPFLVAVLAGLPGRDPVGGVQHRGALDRADGQVEIRHRTRVPTTLSRAHLGQLDGTGVRVRGQVPTCPASPSAAAPFPAHSPGGSPAAV